MDKTELVEKLIRGTVQRAVQETVAVALVLVAFTAMLWNAPGLKFYGCALILAGTAFVVVMVWRFSLSRRMLNEHPPTDTAFWQGACRDQARALRLVPLWYLAPLCPGLALFFVPTEPGQLVILPFVLTLVLLVFGAVIWVNRVAARKYDQVAHAIAD